MLEWHWSWIGHNINWHKYGNNRITETTSTFDDNRELKSRRKTEEDDEETTEEDR